MISVKELRIGNLVKDKAGNIWRGRVRYWYA